MRWDIDLPEDMKNLLDLIRHESSISNLMLNTIDNINIFEPEWIVPKNIFALQTTRNI